MYILENIMNILSSSLHTNPCIRDRCIYFAFLLEGKDSRLHQMEGIREQQESLSRLHQDVGVRQVMSPAFTFSCWNVYRYLI